MAVVSNIQSDVGFLKLHGIPSNIANNERVRKFNLPGPDRQDCTKF